MPDSILTSPLTLSAFLACTGTSLALGVGIALLCLYKNRCSQSFVLTLAILPAVVQLVILLVNGSVGTGIAVAGAFGLVRFRSVPGSAREIGLLFLAMAVGLATGMGYIFIACVFFAIMAVFVLALTALHFGAANDRERILKITVPESMDYEDLFDDLFRSYTRHAELYQVKTGGMGTLYELEYRIILKTAQPPRAFLDEMRCRNGNLKISISRPLSRETL